MLYIIIFVLFIIIAAAAWLLWEPYCIAVREKELKYDSLPEEFNGFSVLFMSDIHTSKWGFMEKKLCGKLETVPKCDICILGGDLAYRAEVTENIPKILSHAKIGGDVFCVPGNTEYKPHNDPEELFGIYSGFGYNVLRNSNVALRRNGKKIIVAGADDPINFMEDIPKTFSGTEKEDFKILVSHCPSVAPDVFDFGVNLVLAGHTHGGQVKLPFFTVYTHMNRNKYLNKGIWDGEKLGRKLGKKLRDFYLVISNGIGCSQLWIRFNARPEIYRITLKKK